MAGLFPAWEALMGKGLADLRRLPFGTRKGGTLKRIVICLIAILMCSATLMAAEPIVKRIEISGLRRIDEFSVRNRISQRVGRPLDAEGVREDIKKIYGMGYFDDVRVEMDFFEGGVKLIYMLREKPVVARVSFYGNDEFDDDRLKEHVTITRGSIADENLINDNALQIKAFYESEGYWLAEVVPLVRRVGESSVHITYLIDEGEKIRIDEIRIVGNSMMDEDDIKDVMDTSEWWLFSFLTSGGYYKSSVIKQDISKIRDLYFDNGFLKVKVSEPEIELDREDSEMDVTIHISEGRQYMVDSVSIEGNSAFSTRELEDLIHLKAGEVFSKKTVGADVRALTDFYSDRGYAMVSIDPGVDPLPGKDAVKVTYRILEGDIFHVGRIEISGNSKTKDKVIRREMKLDEGDVFNRSLLKRSYQRLNNLNFFETVQIEPKPRPEEKLLDIDVKVKDKSTGTFSVGGGYSTVDKFVGLVDLTQANLFGNGQYLKLKGEFGGRATLYEISYRDPWFLDKPLSMTLRIYRSMREYFDYDRKSVGFGIGFSKPFAEYWRAGFSYNLEKVEIYNVDDDASSLIRDQEGESVTSSIAPSLARDSRDYFLDPHEGSRNALFLKLAGLGGDNRYFKGIIDSSWFVPFGPTTFALRGRYGYATGLGGKELPLYERFFVGGINTIRGLGYGEAGPRDDEGEKIGGEEEIIFNFEFIFPLLPEIRLKGLLFYDTGKAYNHGDSLSGFRHTAGAGIRWISPIGPLRFEWGYVLDRKEGEEQSKFEFTFGTFF